MYQQTSNQQSTQQPYQYYPNQQPQQQPYGQYPQEQQQQQQQQYSQQQNVSLQQPYPNQYSAQQNQEQIPMKEQQQQDAIPKNPFEDCDIGEGLLGTAGFTQRKQFIIKVYSILSIQLFCTFGLVLITCFSQGLRDLMINPITNQATLFYWCCFAIAIITEIAIFCCKNVARKVPNNYIALAIFTASFSVVVGGSCALCYNNFENGGTLILCAALMTFAVTVALTIYAFTTKTDFTMIGGSLFIMTTVVLVFSIFLFFCFNVWLYLMLCAVCVILYGFYLIYDTQLVIGGKQHQLQIDDYIIGALIIYIDIIILFLRLLQILMILFGKK